MAPRLIVRATPLNGPQVALGTDTRRGVYVEDFQCSADQWGPLDASFTLKRSPRTTWPDIGFWAPIEAELENQLLWSGRVLSTPGSESDTNQITVNCQGWQGHLDDRPFTQMYVHSALTDFADVRGLPDALLGQGSGAHPASCQVNAATDGITLMFPANVPIGQFEGCSAQLDLGPFSNAKRISIDVQTSNNDGNVSLFCFVGNSDQPQQGTFTNPITQTINVASATLAGTATPQRYVSFRLQRQGVGYTPGVDIWAKVTRCQIFTDTAFESGNASILKASDIVKDCLLRLVLLDPSTLLIATPSFSIPTFNMANQTPRDAITASNSFQNWQARVTADRKLEYRAMPASPIVALSDQSSFDDLSAGSGDVIYSEVYYQGTGPDGAPVSVWRTAAAAGLSPTIPDRRGGVKGYVIQSDAALTPAAAQQLCDVFLAQHNKMPFRGTIHATSRRSVSLHPSGANCPTYQLLRYPGELCTFKHLQDPDTGALGRDGRIAKVTYTWQSDSAQVDIDSTPGSFEAIAARLAVVTNH